MPDQTKDNPGVVAPPPLIYLSAIILSLLLNYIFSFELPLPRNVALALSVLLVATAVYLFAAAYLAMRRARTNIEPWKPTTAIISTGVYAFTRNPIYLAFTLVYLASGLFFDTLWTLILLAPLVAVVQIGVIEREEKYLEQKFGDQYSQYKKRVRRWI